MNRRTLSKRLEGFLFFAVAVSVACVLLSGNVSAQLTDHKTPVTFNAPFEISGSDGQVLPAGTYVFKVVDSKANRNIVQILSEDETRVYSTLLAIPAHREETTDTTVMTFEERAAGAPQALKMWFYPHEKDGQEFLFTKQGAITEEREKLSTATVIPETRRAAVEPAPVVAAQTPVTAPELAAAPPAPAPIAPQSEPVQIAQAQTPPSSQQTPVQAQTLPENLPRTASNLPLLGLMGCLALGAGLSIRRLCGR